MALSVTSVLSKAAPVGKCYGLALASGESNGPYQAGAIVAMLEEFAKNSTINETISGTYNAVSGVTEGALNAYLISLHENEQSGAAVLSTMKTISDFWLKLG
jgi:predicted acylesterase/phospholipase RssA